MSTGVKNVCEYIKAIKDIYEDEKFTGKDKSGLFFRGHTKSEYKLLPKVFRKTCYNERKILLNYRDHLYRMTPLKLDFINNRIEILVEMQHYGIPTRLLDWTLSPLIALYFAVRDSNNKECEQDDAVECEQNAVVWIFNPWTYQYKLRSDNASTNWFEMSKFARALLSDRKKFSDIKGILKVKYYGDTPLTEDYITYPFPLITQYQNPRIIQQSGVFTIHGSCEKAFEDLSISGSCLRKIIISKSKKNNILEELRLLYINDFIIFPDHEGMRNEFDKHGSLYHVK